MTVNEIKEWLVYIGGICPAEDNHFGEIALAA